jgi:hypothetical protein
MKELTEKQIENKIKPFVWMTKGTKVNYHSIIGGPVTIEDAVITEEPYMFSGHTPCVWIDKKNCVASCDAISKA